MWLCGTTHVEATAVDDDTPLYFGSNVLVRVRTFTDTFYFANLFGETPCEDASSTTFYDLPTAVAHASRVCRLYLRSDGELVIGSELGAMRHLQILEITHASPLTLPSSLPILPRLRELTMQNSELTALPENIGTWNQLTSLDLTQNSIRSLPDSMQQLTKLLYVSLEFNPIASEEVDRLRAWLSTDAEILYE